MYLSKKKYETGYLKYLREEEFEKLLTFLYSRKSPSLKICILSMAYLGLRVSDAVELKRTNFNHDFTIMTKTIRKTKKTLTRILPGILVKQLKHYYRNWSSYMIDDYLFFANYCNQSKNKYLQKSTIQIFFSKLRKHYGWDIPYHTRSDGKTLHRISPHVCRHYAAWKYYKASGNDGRAVQQMLGHKHIDTTMKYINALQNIDGREKQIINDAWNRQEAIHEIQKRQ